jgi:hypothetical protein
LRGGSAPAAGISAGQDIDQGFVCQGIGWKTAPPLPERAQNRPSRTVSPENIPSRQDYPSILFCLITFLNEKIPVYFSKMNHNLHSTINIPDFQVSGDGRSVFNKMKPENGKGHEIHEKKQQKTSMKKGNAAGRLSRLKAAGQGKGTEIPVLGASARRWRADRALRLYLFCLRQKRIPLQSLALR